MIIFNALFIVIWGSILFTAWFVAPKMFPKRSDPRSEALAAWYGFGWLIALALWLVPTIYLWKNT